MNFWRWAAIMALPFLAIALSFGRIEGIHSCHSAAEPILAFELVTSPAEVAALFPAGCAGAAAKAQIAALKLDNLGFIPVYSGLLILVLLALGQERGAQRGLVRLGIGLVLCAVLADYWENNRLAAILAQLPGDQATIDQLIPAPRIKFAALALAEMLAGWLHWRAAGWRRWAGGAMILGGLLSLAGFAFEPLWVIQGGTLAFLAAIMSSAVLAWRRAPA